MSKTYIQVLLSFLIFVNNSYAMKRNIEEKDIDTKDVKLSPTKESQLEYLQNDALVVMAMIGYLTIEDISLRLVSKSWLESAKKCFPEFYGLMTGYDECTRAFRFDNLFETLQKLRKASHKFTSRYSKEELAIFKQVFLIKNNESLREMATSLYGQDNDMSKWLFNNDIKAHPKWWMQLALLRIWDFIKIGDEFPFKKYYVPALKMLALNSELKDYFRAESDFKTKLKYAIELCDRGSDGATAVVSYAEMYMRQNHSDEAAQLYDIVIEKNSKVATKIYELAACAHGNMLNWRRAEELFDMSFKINTDVQIDAYKNAALVQRNLKNWQKAAEFYERALKKNPASAATVYEDAAFAYKKLKNYQRSAQLYDMALGIDPNSAPVIYSEAAYAHAEMENYSRAAELLEIALSRGENTLFTFFNAVQVYMHLNNLNRAQEIFETLSKLKFMLTQDPAMHFDICKLGVSLYKSVGDQEKLCLLHFEMKELGKSLAKSQ